MAFLEIHGLNKSFGAQQVLTDIHLFVAEGEFFVILGPSGGGKSTLLRVLCGIEKEDSGEINLAGRNITNLPARDRNIGMVFQDYGLYPHMNVWDNIAYGLETRGTPRNIIEQRIKIAAEKLGITPLLQRVIVDLSGGEQQRVALARALAKDSELYLFDEPLSNLDPKLRVKARRDILMVHREKRKPTIYVTHDQNEAISSGDRIGIVAKGHLQQVGTPDDLVERPASLFVARFIGIPPMNLVKGTLSFDSDKSHYAVLLVGQTTLYLPARWNDRLRKYNKSDLIVGIPPSAFSEARIGNRPSPETLDTVLEAKIENVEALVGEVIVNLTIGAESNLAVLFQGVAEEEFTNKHYLSLHIDSERVSLFDPDSENALFSA